MSTTKHDSPLADNAFNTTPPPIDEIARDLEATRVRITDIYYPKDNTVDPSPYFPTIIRCIYDLFTDHRGTSEANAWITS